LKPPQKAAVWISTPLSRSGDFTKPDFRSSIALKTFPRLLPKLYTPLNKRVLLPPRLAMSIWVYRGVTLLMGLVALYFLFTIDPKGKGLPEYLALGFAMLFGLTCGLLTHIEMDKRKSKP
jgi:hypothetical protein